MLKKIIIGVLVFSVLSAGGAALAYSAANTGVALAKEQPLDQSQAEVQLDTSDQGYGNRGQGSVSQNEQNGLGNQNGNAQGEPWKAVGTIVALDDFGMAVALDEGEEVYIELGPPTYWQTQDAVLEIGGQVEVEGTINEDMIHASSVMLADGGQLVLRNESGQPMWSGGAQNEKGGNGNAQQGANGAQDGSQTPDPQVQIEEWITLEGVLIAQQGGQMTIETVDGEQISMQTGKPSFFTSQDTQLNEGDAISVLGFWSNDRFSAAEITILETGQRIMLRDPNGRPLWAGPGNSGGQGGGNDRGGHGQGGNGQGGNGKGGNGGGNGYSGL